MELYLSMEEKYEQIDNDNLKEEVFFRKCNFYVTNDLEKAKNIDSQYHQFKEVIKEKDIDFRYDLLEYNYNIDDQLKTLTKKFSLEEDKLKEFSKNFKEKIVFDNYTHDLNDSISVITYKDKVVAYNLDKRCKRDFNDYIYFKDEDSLKRIIEDYFKLFKTNKLSVDLVDLSNIQTMDCLLFKEQVKIISKEEYLEKNREIEEENMDRDLN